MCYENSPKEMQIRKYVFNCKSILFAAVVKYNTIIIGIKKPVPIQLGPIEIAMSLSLETETSRIYWAQNST
jgi:hypothetical protein